MNDCGAKSKLSAPLIDLSKTGNYSFVECFEDFGDLAQVSFFPGASGRKLRRKDYKVLKRSENRRSEVSFA